MKYDWGDQHDEVFKFKYLSKALHGTATYLTVRRIIEQAKVEGESVSFITHSQQMLGSDNPWKEFTHRYTGQITPNGIRFTLEDSGSNTPHAPVEFVARRESVKQGGRKSGALELGYHGFREAFEPVDTGDGHAQRVLLRLEGIIQRPD